MTAINDNEYVWYQRRAEGPCEPECTIYFKVAGGTMIQNPSFLGSFNALADVAGCPDMIQTEGGPAPFPITKIVLPIFLHLM